MEVLVGHRVQLWTSVAIAEQCALSMLICGISLTCGIRIGHALMEVLQIVAECSSRFCLQYAIKQHIEPAESDRSKGAHVVYVRK
eukprot:5054840-Amphidinium_carterae.2